MQMQMQMQMQIQIQIQIQSRCSSMVGEGDTQAAALLCADRFSDTLLLSWIIHTRQSRRTVQIFFILDMVLVIILL